MERNITTQKEIVDLLWQRSGKEVSKEMCGRLYSLLKHILIEKIIQTDRVYIRGLGMFYKKKYSGHIKNLCNNFKTREYYEGYVPDRIVVKFRSGKYMKKRLNNHEGT